MRHGLFARAYVGVSGGVSLKISVLTRFPETLMVLYTATMTEVIVAVVVVVVVVTEVVLLLVIS